MTDLDDTQRAALGESCAAGPAAAGSTPPARRSACTA